jgi:hypothetical protein
VIKGGANGVVSDTTISTGAAVLIMVLLAGFDFVATVFAKEWSQHRQPWQLAVSAAAFTGLFLVLVAGVHYSELTVITMGWVVVLQTGIVAIDWARYGFDLTPKRLAAIVAILVLQGYLVAGGPRAGATGDVKVDQSRAANAAS